MLRTLLAGSTAALLVLAVPGCQPDVTLKHELDEEQKRVRQALADRASGAAVEVHATPDGRQVEVTLSGAPDSLAQMNIFSPPDTAQAIARAVARDVKADYDGFGDVQELTVGFASESSAWTSSVTLEGEELQTLNP